MEPTAITTTGAPGATSTPKASSSALGNADLSKDQFLKLFVAQLKHQDPMSPMQDMEFMGQMASFSTLEQITNMAVANEAMAVNQYMNQSVNLIGRTVTWTDDADATHTGVVEKVNYKDGYPVLTVSGTEGVDPNQITQIA
jgi:flagellar basal-body rod modification protein FlgD